MCVTISLYTDTHMNTQTHTQTCLYYEMFVSTAGCLQETLSFGLTSPSSGYDQHSLLVRRLDELTDRSHPCDIGEPTRLRDIFLAFRNAGSV